MKFLIASVGNRLDSFVAKRFEHAAWYLIVDMDTLAVDTTQHLTPHVRHAVLLKAAVEKVHAVVAGKIGETSLKLIRTHDMQVALVHGMSVRNAMERITSHEIKLVEAEEIERERGIVVGTVQRLIPKVRNAKTPLAGTISPSDSARGQHHLQQYGGRGH